MFDALTLNLISDLWVSNLVKKSSMGARLLKLQLFVIAIANGSLGSHSLYVKAYRAMQAIVIRRMQVTGLSEISAVRKRSFIALVFSIFSLVSNMYLLR